MRTQAARTPTGTLLLFLLLVDSLHFVFARLLTPHLPAQVAGLYVLAVGTVEVGLFLLLRRRIAWHVLWENKRFFLALGLLVGGATAFSYNSVRFVDPGTASFLSQSTTLFSLFLGVVWLRDTLSRPEMFGALVAISGVFAIGFQPGSLLRWGALLVLLSTFLYALHAALVKRYGGDLDFGNFFFFRLASTSAFLLLFSIVGGNLPWPTAPVWGLLLLAGTVDVVISRILYYAALRRLQISVHAVVLTLSPVVTTLWSLLLFRERPTLAGLIGGATVVFGIVLVSLGRQRRRGGVGTGG